MKMKMKFMVFMAIALTSLTFITSTSEVSLNFLDEKEPTRVLTNWRTDNTTSSIFYADNIACTNQNCQAPYGQCTYDKTMCICFHGYLNTPEKLNETKLYCTYEQKSQNTAFLLTMFFFFVGNFYVGNIAHAVPQLILTLIPCILCCIGMATGVRQSEGKGKAIMGCLMGTVCCACTVWLIVDMVLFGNNRIKDSNDYPLKAW